VQLRKAAIPNAAKALLQAPSITLAPTKIALIAIRDRIVTFPDFQVLLQPSPINAINTIAARVVALFADSAARCCQILLQKSVAG